MPAITTYTKPLTTDQVARLKSVLQDGCYTFESKPYCLYAATKNKLNVLVYEKGPKVLVQGKETEDFIRFTLEPEVTGVAKLDYEEVLDPDKFAPHFGIDESGKGDYFGPLVIAGAYTDATIARHLIDAGIMDSKRVTSPARIRQLAAIIRATPGCTTAVIAIGPNIPGDFCLRANAHALARFAANTAALSAPEWQVDGTAAATGLTLASLAPVAMRAYAVTARPVPEALRSRAAEITQHFRDDGSVTAMGPSCAALAAAFRAGIYKV